MAAKATRGVLLKHENLLSRYKGALVGAVVGDCLGAHFEFNLEPFSRHVPDVTNFFLRLPNLTLGAKDSESESDDGDKGKSTASPEKKRTKVAVERRPMHEFTDDTAMARSVWRSLIKQNKADATDLAKHFVCEYNKEPHRGYGASVGKVFKDLKVEEYKDPFGPASRQFDGSGSYGNGGAMRIAPAALYGLNLDDDQFNSVVDTITKVTHSNHNAVNGARLQCAAVRAALRLPNTDTFDTDKYLSTLQSYVASIEPTPLDQSDNSSVDTYKKTETPYKDKLKLITEHLKAEEDITRTEIEETLGNDVSALGSVPAAVYSFLRAKKPIDDVPMTSAFERTIVYAITLGGDTDTIAAMAGAIAGAYYGIDAIPILWRETCECVEEAEEAATSLHKLVFAHKD